MLAEVEHLATPDRSSGRSLHAGPDRAGRRPLLLMVVGALTPRRPKLRRGTPPLTIAIAARRHRLVGLSAVVPGPRRRPDLTRSSDAVRGRRPHAVPQHRHPVWSVVLAALLAHGYLRRERLEGPESYVLLLLSASGGVIMAGANDLLVLFLGLEILSIAVYVLAGIHVRRARSREAALKYFVLGAFSSAFFLYGIALVYGATGTTNLAASRRSSPPTCSPTTSMLLAGFALLLVGLGFKVAAVAVPLLDPRRLRGLAQPGRRLHGLGRQGRRLRRPDPGLRLRLHQLPGRLAADRSTSLAVVTLLVGSVLAVSQTNVKRMLAYSSISHAGFILVGVQAASERGTRAALFYLAAYTFMVAGSFGVVTVVGRTGDNAHDLSTTTRAWPSGRRSWRSRS